MNIEALKKTRALLASERGKKYDQTSWKHGCGSPACVAGFACEANDVSMETGAAIPNLAREILGLVHEEGVEMFSTGPKTFIESRASKGILCSSLGYRPFPNREEAIAMLDHAIKHQEVRWEFLR